MTTELGKKLGIQESEMTYLKQFGASDDFPLLVLLEWKKRLGVASRPQLAEALLQCGFTSLAIKLDNTGKYAIINSFNVHVRLCEAVYVWFVLCVASW